MVPFYLLDGEMKQLGNEPHLFIAYRLYITSQKQEPEIRRHLEPLGSQEMLRKDKKRVTESLNCYIQDEATGPLHEANHKYLDDPGKQGVEHKGRQIHPPRSVGLHRGIP